MNMSSDNDVVRASMQLRKSQLWRNSPLVNYALAGLQKCWLPEHGRWSHIYHLDGRDYPNESLPHSDVFYTLNVLLGMSRLNAIPVNINTSEIFERNVSQLTRLPVSNYAFGMALWTAAELNLQVPPDVVRHLNRLLAEKKLGGLSSARSRDVAYGNFGSGQSGSIGLAWFCEFVVSIPDSTLPQPVWAVL
ncbi:hypothetical protein V1282_002399 [Nitrobacteraceae bacterium AZCC 2146]